MKMIFVKTCLVAFIFTCQSIFGSLVVVELDEHQQLFQSIFKKIEQPINEIIKQEIDKALESEKRKAAFYPTTHTPKQFHMSLAYVYGLKQQHFPALVQGLDLMQSLDRGSQLVEDVNVSNKFDFFGKFHNFLILKINDSKGTLYRLHYDIKQMLQLVHAYFAKGTKRRLFNLEKLNEFYFSPHVTLAMFPVRKIKQVLHMPKSQSDLILDTMRQRIFDEVLSNIEVSKAEQEISIHSFTVWGKKKEVLKKYTIGKTEQEAGFLESGYRNILQFFGWLKARFV